VDPHVAFQRPDHQRDDLPIDEREDVEDQQREDQEPGLALRGRGGGVGRRRQHGALLSIQTTPCFACAARGRAVRFHCGPKTNRRSACRSGFGLTIFAVPYAGTTAELSLLRAPPSARTSPRAAARGRWRAANLP